MDNHNSFGEGTPFDYMVNHHGKFLVLGNTTDGALTLSHHFEALFAVPYRAEKVFEGEYVDENGKKSIRRYSMHVRPLNYSVSMSEEMADIWRKHIAEEGALYTDVFGTDIIRAIYDCNALKGIYKKELVDNEAMHWTFEGKHGYRSCGVNWEMARYYA